MDGKSLSAVAGLLNRALMHLQFLGLADTQVIIFSGTAPVSQHIKPATLCLALSILGIAGCANHTQQLYDAADLAHRNPVIFDTGVYRIQAVLPSVRTKHLRIYIEGDGKAWATRTQPSTDPTPTKQFVSQLAATDPNPSAYIARPCQFVQDVRCNTQVWTDLRFSRDAVNSIAKAVEMARQSVGAEQIDLVGYSGGGALALLVAAGRHDVTAVQTLAGNLSPGEWTELKGLSGLRDAMEPADYADKLRMIPQRHLVGSGDKTVPPALARKYISSLGASACVQVVTVSATHEKGWESAWSDYRTVPISCMTPSALKRATAAN